MSSDILSDLCLLTFLLASSHRFYHISFDILFDISSDMSSEILADICFDILSDIPRRTEPWGPFSIHFTALKMNPFKRTTSFVPAHVPAAPGPA